MHRTSCKQLAYLWRFNGNEGFNGATVVLTGILCLIDVSRSVNQIGNIPILSFIQLNVLVGLPLLLAYVGNYMRNEFDGSREMLANAFGLFIQEHDPGCFNTNQLERITKWLLDWDWKFTARNVFDVNYKIFGVVLGTLMTYFIVIFQLLTGDKANKSTISSIHECTCSNMNNDSLSGSF
ncbi:unnamed protein product [Allacma fusca]|uniref:Uncharacterized protein n=1 Tax=Allacma fusca TaxID=39272 RepID=A0A8J2NIK0_9HEXA|nr:unnamed protein product [Allacma fusca]